METDGRLLSQALQQMKSDRGDTMRGGAKGIGRSSPLVKSREAVPGLLWSMFSSN